MAENFFRAALQHHLNQTRAGRYGQFEHSFNFNTGSNQDDLLKIGPGESITFSGELTNGQVCSLIASNNLTDTSGAGYAAQPETVNGRIVTIPVTPKKGNATLEFSCPTSGGTSETVSYATLTSARNEDRWEAIDENNMVIFSQKAVGTLNSASDIVRSAAGDYYVTGRETGVEKYDINGVLQWTGTPVLGDLSALVAYDPVHNVAAGYMRDSFGSGATKVVAFDAAGPDQGGGGLEPDALWTTFTSAATGPRRLFDFKADGNGFFIAAVIRNDQYDGPLTGFANILKIDALTGEIVATYNTNNLFGNLRLAIDAATGNIAIASSTQSTPSPLPPTDLADLIIIDSDLNYVSHVNIPWDSFTPYRFMSYVIPTFDSSSRVYGIGASGYMVRYNSTLTTLEVSKSLFSPPLTTNGRHLGDAGHNLDGNIIVFAGGPEFADRGTVFRFNNDGVEVDQYDVEIPSATLTAGHVLVGGPVAGPDLGNLFTQERSLTPPGRTQAIAAVKYAAGNITGIFFNSVNVEFDHSKWSAFHSVNGPVDIGATAPGWEYNSPL